MATLTEYVRKASGKKDFKDVESNLNSLLTLYKHSTDPLQILVNVSRELVESWKRV